MAVTNMTIHYNAGNIENLSKLYPKRVNIQYNWNGPYGHPWGFGEYSRCPKSGEDVVKEIRQWEADYNKTSYHEAWLELRAEAIF